MIRAIAAFFLVLAFCLPVVAQPPTVIEKRVILDEDFMWLKPDEADLLLSRIKRAGFNVFVPVVWHGRGAAWETQRVQKEPRWQDRAKNIKDPLKSLIDKAHAQGIEVHPWFTVVLRQRDIFPEFYDEGTPKKAFNIHNKQYRDFIIELMLEVVRNYDIDGINLDYIRSMGNCLSATCVADYKARTGRDLIKDDKQRWGNADAAASVGAWNEVPVTDIVKRFSEQARALKPNLLISVDTHPINRRLSMEGANAIAWANAGYIDMIYDMQYKEELDLESFDMAKAKLIKPSKLALMIGNFETSRFDKSKVWPRNAKLVAKHTWQAINAGAESKSIVVYDYRFLSNEQIQHLQLGPFKQN
jgi:uncharacterized lipoprotein YddW (UPF0748 family)